MTDQIHHSSIGLLVGRRASLLVAVWNLWRTGDLGVAAAAAVMKVMIMGLLVWLVLMATGGRLTQE